MAITIKSNYKKSLIVLWLFFLVTATTSLIGISKSVNIIFAFGINVFFSILFGLAFLYIFSHKDFFPFAKDIEKSNSKKEKKLLKTFKKYGAVLVTILVGLLSGPLFAGLTASILTPKLKSKYYLVALASFLSAVFWLAVAKGIIHITF